MSSGSGSAKGGTTPRPAQDNQNKRLQTGSNPNPGDGTGNGRPGTGNTGALNKNPGSDGKGPVVPEGVPALPAKGVQGAAQGTAASSNVAQPDTKGPELPPKASQETPKNKPTATKGPQSASRGRDASNTGPQMPNNPPGGKALGTGVAAQVPPAIPPRAVDKLKQQAQASPPTSTKGSPRGKSPHSARKPQTPKTPPTATRTPKPDISVTAPTGQTLAPDTPPVKPKTSDKSKSDRSKGTDGKADAKTGLDPGKNAKNGSAANATKADSSGEGGRGSGSEKEGGEADGEARPKAVSRKLLLLAQKSDWSGMEHFLRNLDKGAPELLVTDSESSVSPLMLAVRENRLVLAERLLDLGVEINHQAQDQRTALHFSASYSRDDVVKLLIVRKADATLPGGARGQLALHMACGRASGVVTTVQMLLKATGKDARLATDKEGAIPLFLAAEVGNTAVCRELLAFLTEEQVKTQKRDNKDSVMHIACRRKDFDMVKLFVESGADVDMRNEEGLSPMHVSAWEGDEQVIKYLNQVKANPNIVDKLDRSPLHIAAERGHTNIVEILVDKFRASVSARTKDGSTLMHIASLYGHPDTALAFLKKGVPMLMPNKSGAICLHAAAEKGHTSVIRSLLTKGAPVDAVTKDNYTALHIAVEHCKPLAVQTLLGYGAKVELKGGKSKETPLHIAARVEGGEKCAEMLLKSGANVNATKENGETALHIAARHGHQQMTCALIAEGADPTWASKAGESPLHIAVRYCHWEVAEELLRFVAQDKSRMDAALLVNAQNAEGETAVHYATELTKAHAHHEFEDTDIIKLLLEYDGDTNVHTKLTSETPLHYCARSGNADVLLEIVKYLGSNRVQTAVNKQAKNGWSPLLVASEHGHLDILQILLAHHARVDVFDEHGKAALHLAAENGHDAVAEVLLQHKAFVNAKSKLGLTPLHMSAQNGYNPLVTLFIDKHGATIDALSLAKKTPLHLAAQNGQMEVCNTLLKMKADANATDVHGQTPLHLAGEHDHSDVVKLFLKHRPELVTMANTNGMTCAHIAAVKGSVAVVKELMRFNKAVVTTARNKNNDSSTLHMAASGGHSSVVRALLEAGASPTDENGDGMTAIHLAARHGHIEVLDALRKYMSWKVTSTKTGLTALHVAAQYGQMEFVREMLSKVPATVRSEPPHKSDGPLREVEHGLTPLHLAAQSGHEGLVRLLLNSSGVQVDAATAVQGVIPLHQAAQHGHTAVVSLLLSKSTSQIHLKDKRGRTGLHLAAAHGHIDMVALLLGQGADINCFDKNGFTPLHYAAKAGHLDVVKLLMETGADPTHETKDGKVALCFAASHNHPEVLSYLLKNKHDTHSLLENKKFVFDLMGIGKMTDNKSIQEFILVSPAPVTTAASMSRAFRLLATKEKERAKDLLNAGDFCEAMATELTAIAASVSSASMLLKAVDHKAMPLLDVLIDCEQKEVVSHPSVQRYLTEVWTGHLSHWSGFKMIALFMILVFIPPVWLAISMPNKHIRFNKVPVIKFMSYLVSHFYLIGLFTLTTVFPIYQIYESSSLIPHWYEWLLLAWLSGLLVSQLTNPEDRAGLGWLKVIVIVLSAVGVFIHVMAFAFNTSDRFQCLYIRNQFFALALLLCFVQFLDFLSFHHLFGPWAIIIRDLMKDLIRFLVILLLFMLGFTLQLAAIYKDVTRPVLANPELGDGDGAGGAVSDGFMSTFELLFFALFGLVDPENLPPVNNSPFFAIYLAKGVFGIYLIITIIVLINLLIAMMSDTYQRIQAASDTEWKFGRAKLFRNMNKTSATPSPMNLVTKLVVYITILVKHRGQACSMEAQQFVDEEEQLDVVAAESGQNTGQNWMKRRNTQVAPEDDFLAARMGTGPVPIEDVVKWSEVADRYLQLTGQGDGVSTDKDALEEGGTEESVANMTDPNGSGDLA